MFSLFKLRSLIFGLFVVLLLAIIACGQDAVPAPAPVVATQPEPTPNWSAIASQAATDAAAKHQPAAQAAAAPVATAKPVAKPAALAPVAKVGPTGNLDVSVGDLGFYTGIQGDQTYTATRFDGLITHEALWAHAPDGTIIPRLVKDWSVDSSGLEYTFQLQDGVKWHQSLGDWGEFNADDFIFSLKEVGKNGSIHSTAGRVRSIFLCDGCSLEKVDDLTLKLTRPKPTFEIAWVSLNPGGQTTLMHSKSHFDAVGADAASHQSVGTGPFEMVEYRDEQYKKAKAVSDHWRKTPEWATTTWWDIDEESTRLANFQSGLLDIGSFAQQSLDAIRAQNNPNIKYMNFPGAYYIYLLFGSQYYHDDHPAHLGDDPKVPISDRDFTCSDFPYVSCNRDTNSAEWKQARDVRLAMNTAIDREALVNNIFAGNGSPFYISWWLGHEGRIKEFELDKLKWDYDPTKAQDLLKGAGYPDGIDIDITIHPGFQPGSNVAAEAVIGMWEDIGVRTTVTRTPYSVYRPNLIRRTTSTLLNLTDVPYVEAYRLYSPAFNPSSGFNFGIEHPVLTDYIDEASGIVDDDQRWAVMAEAAKWLFDNSLHIPLFEVNSVWPLGPELDPWETLGINRGWLSNYEFAPHRQ